MLGRASPRAAPGVVCALCLLHFVNTGTLAQTVHVVNANPDNTFTPQTVTIQQGDTVTWINQGGVHNVAAQDGSFRCAVSCVGTGGDPAPGWSFSLTFSSPGTIDYLCETHQGLGMTGRVIVQGQPQVPTAVIPIAGSRGLLLLTLGLILTAITLIRRQLT